MPRTPINIVPRIFTRRALVGVIEAHRHDHDRKHRNPGSVRRHAAMPLTLIVGLMTTGVILIASLLQLLSSYLG